MDNPHAMVVDLLESGKAEWCGGSLNMIRVEVMEDDTRVTFPQHCALGLYGKACLNTTQMDENRILIGLFNQFGRKCLLDLADIMIEQFAPNLTEGEQLNMASWRKRGEKELQLLGKVIVTINDWQGFSQEDMLMASTKAAIKWDEEH